MSKRDSRVAAARKEMADVYRATRKISPSAARAMKRRYDAVYKEVSANFHKTVYETGISTVDDDFRDAFE